MGICFGAGAMTPNKHQHSLILFWCFCSYDLIRAWNRWTYMDLCGAGLGRMILLVSFGRHGVGGHQADHRWPFSIYCKAQSLDLSISSPLLFVYCYPSVMVFFVCYSHLHPRTRLTDVEQE